MILITNDYITDKFAAKKALKIHYCKKLTLRNQQPYLSVMFFILTFENNIKISLFLDTL